MITSLQVICGLAHPQLKILATPMFVIHAISAISRGFEMGPNRNFAKNCPKLHAGKDLFFGLETSAIFGEDF